MIGYSLGSITRHERALEIKPRHSGDTNIVSSVVKQPVVFILQSIAVKKMLETVASHLNLICAKLNSSHVDLHLITKMGGKELVSKL